MTFGERSVWVRKFLRHGTKIASLTPSSKWLCQAMCRELNPEREQVIVELGSGTGPLTELVHRTKNAKSRFLSVEIDDDLHKFATARCPEVDIAKASVEELPHLLKERGIDHIDVMLSCLPMPSMPHHVNQVVLETWQALTTNGIFTQITQVPWWFQPTYRRVFQTVTFDLVMMNPPPGGVYHCQNLYDDFRSPERMVGKSVVSAAGANS